MAHADVIQLAGISLDLLVSDQSFLVWLASRTGQEPWLLLTGCVWSHSSLALCSSTSSPSPHFPICKMGITSTTSGCGKDGRGTCTLGRRFAHWKAPVSSLSGVTSTPGAVRPALFSFLALGSCFTVSCPVLSSETFASQRHAGPPRPGSHP